MTMAKRRPLEGSQPEPLAPDDRQLRGLLRDVGLGEPQVDLWPRLEEAARRATTARSRRWWPVSFATRARGLAAAGLGLALLVAVLGGAWTLFRARSATIAATGPVPDT